MAQLMRSLRPLTFVIGDGETVPAEPNRGRDHDIDPERGERDTRRSQRLR
jgi:hypothetical protein